MLDEGVVQQINTGSRSFRTRGGVDLERRRSRVDIRGSDIISPLLFFSGIYSSKEYNGDEIFRYFLRETQQAAF